MAETYITGDLHGRFPLYKKNIPEFTKDDFLIVCGDFGYIFSEKETSFEKERLDELQSNTNGCTICFVDGNHENFDRLKNLQMEYRFDNEVGVVREGIYHLRRGRPYVINGDTMLTFGGAISTDRMSRIPNINWWYDEVPNDDEIILAENVIKSQPVDYIITHTCPFSVRRRIKSKKLYNLHCPTEVALEGIKRQVKGGFKKWYFGHFHADEIVDNNFRLLYNDIIRIGE
jgi:hypothetical protein